MDELERETTSVVEALGYSLVELTRNKTRLGEKFILYIYRESGIGGDDCDAVVSALHARLEALAAPKEIDMEVSSPGIERVFKSEKEYDIFKGKKVRATCASGAVSEGVLGPREGDRVTVGGSELSLRDITKCKLII